MSQPMWKFSAPGLFRSPFLGRLPGGCEAVALLPGWLAGIAERYFREYVKTLPEAALYSACPRGDPRGG